MLYGQEKAEIHLTFIVRNIISPWRILWKEYLILLYY